MPALDQRHRELLEHDKALFGKREQLMSLWQEIAENFYPERADFTAARSMGSDFAGALDTSYPVLARRDLGNSLGAMLRPSQKDWFHIKKKRGGDEEARQTRVDGQVRHLAAEVGELAVGCQGVEVAEQVCGAVAGLGLGGVEPGEVAQVCDAHRYQL